MKKSRAKSTKATVRSKEKSVITKVRVEKADSEKKSSKQAKLTKVFPKKQKGNIFEGKRDDIENAPDQFLEDEEHSWPHEEQEMRMHTGYASPDVYTPEGREELEEEEGEIAPWEEGFMEGAEQKGELGECAFCEKPLSEDHDKIIEREMKGRIVWFCSEKCARAGKKVADSVRK